MFRRFRTVVATLKAFVFAVVGIIILPVEMARMPAAIQTAYEIEKAPRHQVTVESTSTKPGREWLTGFKRDEYWIRFLEPVANSRDIQVFADDAWLVPGRRIWIAVTADGTPHSANSPSLRRVCLGLLIAAGMWVCCIAVCVKLVYGVLFGNESKAEQLNDDLLLPAPDAARG